MPSITYRTVRSSSYHVTLFFLWYYAVRLSHKYVYSRVTHLTNFLDFSPRPFSLARVGKGASRGGGHVRVHR